MGSVGVCWASALVNVGMGGGKCVGVWWGKPWGGDGEATGKECMGESRLQPVCCRHCRGGGCGLCVGIGCEMQRSSYMCACG